MEKITMSYVVGARKGLKERKKKKKKLVSMLENAFTRGDYVICLLVK